MRVLVTGAGGFVGRYLLDELAANGHTPLPLSRHVPQVCGPYTWHRCDVLDRAALDRIVRDAQPGACIHLAGVSYVPDGQRRPDTMLSVNTTGTLNLLDAVRAHSPATRVLCVSTAHVYGVGLHPGALPEDTPLRPVSLYAISKAAADLAALGYAAAWRLDVLTARPNNHTGPGQSDRFVLPGLLAQARAIAQGAAPPMIRAGNMESERDFTDVRDVVRAYRLLIEHAQSGQAYNIGSGSSIAIGEVVDRLCRLLKIHPEIQVDPDKFRPRDRSPLLDTTQIESQTGWHPGIPFEQTLNDMVAADSTEASKR